MDRKQALYDYLALVATFAFFGFVALIPNREFLTPYGVSVLVWDIIFTVGAATIGYLVYLNWPSESARQAASERKRIMERMKRDREQPRRDELHDQLKLVYRPLMSAVLEMKEGKDTLPFTNLTVGNSVNPWSNNPKIIQQVVEVFDKYLALIENEQVRKGWEKNKDCLRKGEFFYGKDERKWLECIERQHTLINWWLHSP